jgi:hypothetical protein
MTKEEIAELRSWDIGGSTLLAKAADEIERLQRILSTLKSWTDTQSDKWESEAVKTAGAFEGGKASAFFEAFNYIETLTETRV